jgi:DNA primase
MDAVEEIKQRLAIEDVIGEYVELKRAGRNFKALSPFGNEKTPSFMVSPEKQIWHDFSSGKGGNVFTFVMEVEGLDFKAALELLARKAGLDLSQYRSGSSKEHEDHKKRLYEVLELATKFYQIQFKQNRTALEYILKTRHFTKEITLAFQIGYSPDGQDALTQFLLKKGFKADELKAAGLSTNRYGNLNDMFRGRIMVPLHDPFGRVIGFTARLLVDNPNAPKYINTPQTLLYDKGRHIFGLHLAKEAIRKSNFSVVVEGNLDVIASHQAGVANVVATAGTALTEMQLKSLARFTPDIRLAFDQDQAGLNATERSIPIASRVGANLSIITIPEGKDPDELVKKDPKAWETVINKHDYALDWLIKRYQSQLDLKTAQGKKQFSDTILTIVRQLTDSVEQDHYVRRLAELIEISPEALLQKLQGGTAKVVRKKQIATTIHTPVDIMQLRRDQNHLLAIALFYPELRTYVKELEPTMMHEDTAREVLEYLQQHPEATREEAINRLKKLDEYVKILGLLFDELYEAVDLAELHYEAARLQSRIIENYVKTQKYILAESLRGASDAQTADLLEQVKKFDHLLKTVQERMNPK